MMKFAKVQKKRRYNNVTDMEKLVKDNMG